MHIISAATGSRSDFGGRTRFSGQVATVKCYENNPLVRKVCILQSTTTYSNRTLHPPSMHVHASPHPKIRSPYVPPLAQAFEQPGNGRVLVVDGGSSRRCALLGDNIAEMAYKNGWSVRSSVAQRARISTADPPWACVSST